MQPQPFVNFRQREFGSQMTIPLRDDTPELRERAVAILTREVHFVAHAHHAALVPWTEVYWSAPEDGGIRCLVFVDGVEVDDDEQRAEVQQLLDDHLRRGEGLNIQELRERRDKVPPVPPKVRR